MKIDRTVIKETGYITIGQVCLCAVMLVMYFFISKPTLQIILGAVSGSALAVANFFFMGYTIQRAINASENDRALMIKSSQMTRLMLIALIVIVLLAVAKLDPIATLIPLLFPRMLL